MFPWKTSLTRFIFPWKNLFFSIRNVTTPKFFSEKLHQNEVFLKKIWKISPKEKLNKLAVFLWETSSTWSLFLRNITNVKFWYEEHNRHEIFLWQTSTNVMLKKLHQHDFFRLKTSPIWCFFDEKLLRRQIFLWKTLILHYYVFLLKKVLPWKLRQFEVFLETKPKFSYGKLYQLEHVVVL